MTKNIQLDLLNQLIEVFTKQPEIYKIYSFGSINTSKYDCFSDVDLTIVSNDVYRTSNILNKTVSKIDEIQAKYTIFEKDKSAAYTMFLKKYTPYKNIDIGIVPNDKNINLFEGSKLRYKNQHLKQCTDNNIKPQKENVVDHLFLDCFIGSIRYLKHVFRKQPWIAYRFYKGFVEQYLKAKFELDEVSRLGLTEYKYIDKKLKFKMTNLILPSSFVDMSVTYYEYLINYYELRKMQITRENNQFAITIIIFWQGELDKLIRTNNGKVLTTINY